MALVSMRPSRALRAHTHTHTLLSVVKKHGHASGYWKCKRVYWKFIQLRPQECRASFIEVSHVRFISFHSLGKNFPAVVFDTIFSSRYIRAKLIAVCSENPGLSGRYHTGFWSGKRWSCCRVTSRFAEGCDTCTSWSTSSLLKPSAPSITSSANGSSERQQQSSATVTTTTTTTTSETNNNPVVQTRANNGEFFRFFPFSGLIFQKYG